MEPRLSPSYSVKSQVTVCERHVVKIYNATNSVAQFRIGIIFPHCKNALAYYNAGAVVVNSKVVGLAHNISRVSRYRMFALKSLYSKTLEVTS
jgi:hypothetical protein